ncbi:hypothetical protein PYW07_013797 [Mythimna separata]|uniref:Uncharacterized protein n=1 Tax=Mythimna separata TaxID=271217 RepID=A0AAD7YEX2_MYTSE|nr:hypothetical protein PYW07_013797 [Mythimna separata]
MNSLVVLFALVAVAVAAPSAKTDKRSIGHLVYSVPSAPVGVVQVSEPVVATRTVAVAPALYTGASAVSHQSRVDVHSSPAVVTSYSAPVVAEQVVAAPAVYAAPYAAVYSAPSAVSHQSRVDYRSSPAVVSHQVVSPAVVDARSVYAAPSVYASYW